MVWMIYWNFEMTQKIHQTCEEKKIDLFDGNPNVKWTNKIGEKIESVVRFFIVTYAIIDANWPQLRNMIAIRLMFDGHDYDNLNIQQQHTKKRLNWELRHLKWSESYEKEIKLKMVIRKTCQSIQNKFVLLSIFVSSAVKLLIRVFHVTNIFSLFSITIRTQSYSCCCCSFVAWAE